jgi:hypothetical protein
VVTLRVEHTPVIPAQEILMQMPANSRVRLIGFDWSFESATDVLSLYDYLDTMRGLDENGNNMDKAQMQGTIRIDSLTGAQLLTRRTDTQGEAVSIAGLPQGIYIVKANGRTTKIIKR